MKIFSYDLQVGKTSVFHSRSTGLQSQLAQALLGSYHWRGGRAKSRMGVRNFRKCSS